MMYYFCRNPECFSKPWKSDEDVNQCPTCGSSMIRAHMVEWTHLYDQEPSPEQKRMKEIKPL